MASFAGTTQKCTVCEKTAYPVDKLTADGRVYHKACFRCHHCRNTLKLSNYCSFEGVLYCRPHYDQLYKRTGSLDKSFEGTPKIQKPEKPTENENAKVLSNVFMGTKDKCAGCKKTVYPLERVTVNGTPYHKGCFKCSHGGCTISAVNFITHEGKLYCKHHHIQLFKEKGNYSQLDGDREKTPSLTDETSSFKNADEDSENEEVESTTKESNNGDGYDYGEGDDCDSYSGDGDGESESAVNKEVTQEEGQFCEEEEKDDDDGKQNGDNNDDALCEQQNASPSFDDSVSKTNSDLSLPVSPSSSTSSYYNKKEESEVAKENNKKNPKDLLDKLNFQLVDKSGREVKIQVTYRSSERKKKKAQKLATSGSKGGNGKSVETL